MEENHSIFKILPCFQNRKIAFCVVELPGIHIHTAGPVCVDFSVKALGSALRYIFS